MSSTKNARILVSELIVSVRGFEASWSLQWLNVYPELAIAFIVAFGCAQFGVSIMETVPMDGFAVVKENE